MLETEPSVGTGTHDRPLATTRSLTGQLIPRWVRVGPAESEAPVGPDSPIECPSAVLRAAPIGIDGNGFRSALGGTPVDAPAAFAT
ncbi:MAG: hypothetical protein OES47_08450 [Acidobacteriota bacterium]|nr:hypothetical protein [Acidobacteriota bacterium]